MAAVACSITVPVARTGSISGICTGSIARTISGTRAAAIARTITIAVA